MSTSRSERTVGPAGLLALAAVLVHVACFDPYSNQLFEDDALFLAAIPDADRVTTRVPDAGEPRVYASASSPGEALRDVGTVAVYPVWMVQTATGINEFIYALLYVVEAISAEPISEREEDLRRWGPYPQESGYDLVLEMVRQGDRFDYALLWEGADGPAMAPFSGSFMAGDVPREGVGDFLFDFELYEQLEPGAMDVTEGTLFVAHDNSDGQVLLDIELVDLFGEGLEEPASSRNAFYLDPAGWGWFEFAGEYNIEDTDEDVLELFEVRCRWQADGAGRADSRISGGDLEPWGAQFEATECWGSDFLRTHYADDIELSEDVGDPADCVYADEELPMFL